MPIVLSQNGLLIKESTIIDAMGEEYLNSLKKSLTIVSVIEMVEKKLKMFKTINTPTGTIILIPRMFTPKIRELLPDEKFINKIPVQPFIEISQKETFKLYNNQEIFLKKLSTDIFTEENVKNGTASCIAKMGTGQGKTYLAAAVIAMIKKKTLIIVHDKGMQNNEFSTVLTQTLDNLVLCVKNKPELIATANVVILVINTVMKQPLEFFKQFGLIIMDEIHLYCTDKRSEIFWNANVEYVLGMSATPNEKRDLFHKIAQLSVGKIIDVESLPGYESAQKFTAKVLAINYITCKDYVLHETNSGNGRLMTHKTIMRMLEDPYRDRLVIQQLKLLLKDNHNVYIFCQYRDTVMHYYRLVKTEFSDEEILYAPELNKKEMAAAKRPAKIFPMMGGIANEEYENAKQKGNIIVITYSYGGTGKSIPKMTASIFASPMRSNWTQISGRILRLGSDQTIVRQYIDIIDSSTMLKYQFYGTKKDNAADKSDKTRRIPRKEIYADRGFPIKYINVHYTSLMTDEERKLLKKEEEPEVLEEDVESEESETTELIEYDT
jgi:superfamily II DNA or RNA helicase